MPPRLADARVRAAGTLLKTFGAAPLLRAVDRPSRQFVSRMAVGRDADPEVAEFIYELFIATPPASRGGWARALVDALGTRKHIGLQNLTVPTLVIGSEKDRLLPMVSSRHIARMAPNLAEFVELSGGHCAILERPDEVNRQLRWLVESVGEATTRDVVAGRRSSDEAGVALRSRARRPSRTVPCAPRRPPDARTARRPSRNPVHSSAVSVPAQKIRSTGLRSHGP